MACRFIAAVKLSLVLLAAVLLSPAALATSSPTTTTTLTVSQTSPGHYRAIIKVVSDVGNGTPGGGVIFWNRPDPGQPNNLENLAQLTLDGNGEVVYDFAWSRTGTSEFYALYQGQGAFWSSGSNFVPVTIASVQPTTTTVTPSINPAYGNLPFQVTVRVTAEDGSTPTGMVTLFDDNNLFNPPLDGGPVALVNGTATFTVRRDWLAGLWEFWGEEYAYQDTATYRAEFVGGPGFANSTSSSVDVRFKRQPMAVTFSASPNPAKPGQVVTFTGKAKSTVGEAPVGGDFAIYSDGQLVTEGHIASDGSMSGQMTYSAPGQHTVKLKFYVDSTAGWAPAPEDYYATLNVANEDVTTTTLQSSSSTPIVGEEVTFTATVANTSTPATTPTGTVEFFDGQTSLGTDDLSDGTASLTTAALALGGHSVTAKYLGVAGQFFESTSSVLQQTIQAPPVGTATTVTPSMNPAYGNLPLQVTVTVTSADGATPSGTVTLFDDNNLYNHPLDGGPVALVNGTAAFTVRRDLLGAFDEGSAYVDTATFRAEFAGDPGFANSTSSSVDVRFKRQPLVITLAASPNPAKPGQVVTITGTVKSAVGNITFAGAYSIYSDGELIRREGYGPGGVSSADPMIGTTTFNSPGQHTIRLNYGVYDTGGWASFENDHYLTLTVANEDATTTTLQSSKSSAVTGEQVTFTATVSNSGDAAVVPTGTVQFFDGDTLLGEGTLSGGTASYTTSFAAVGSHSITARYLGETDKFLPSTSGALLQNIETSIVETSVSLSATPNPSQLGQEVSLTATITSASGTPTGTVEFFSGADSMGTASLSGGKAVFTTTTLDGGSHSITAVYRGDGVHGASTSGVLVQVVDTSSATIDVVQQKASQAAASISTDIMTDTTSGAISDALSGQVQVLSASDGQVGFTWAPGLSRGGTMVVPTADAPVSTDNPWRFWARVRYTDWAADDLDGKQLNGLIGASMLFGDGMVAGLVAGYEHYDYESTAASTLKGDGLSFGGYVGGKLTDSLTFDTQLHTTVIGYDVASGGVNGDLDAMRLIAAGGFSYALHEGALSFTPTLRASGMWEWQDGYVDSAAVAHGARGFGNARVSSGARVAYTIPLSDGGRLTPYISGFGDWRVSDGDQTTDSALDGLSGRIESGFDLQTRGGINFGASVEFMGLGIEDTLATSYRANLSIPF